MSGYAGYSKSWNAVEAENDGRFPASVLARKLSKRKRYRGCKASDVRRVLSGSEWHHTSKYYNQTTYYDMCELLEEDVRISLRESIALRGNCERAWREAKKIGLVEQWNANGEVVRILTANGDLWHHLTKEQLMYNETMLARLVKLIEGKNTN